MLRVFWKVGMEPSYDLQIVDGTRFLLCRNEEEVRNLHSIVQVFGLISDQRLIRVRFSSLVLMHCRISLKG